MYGRNHAPDDRRFIQEITSGCCARSRSPLITPKSRDYRTQETGEIFDEDVADRLRIVSVSPRRYLIRTVRVALRVARRFPSPPAARSVAQCVQLFTDGVSQQQTLDCIVGACFIALQPVCCLQPGASARH